MKTATKNVPNGTDSAAKPLTLDDFKPSTSVPDLGDALPYLERWNGYVLNTAKGNIGMCKTLAEAKEKLVSFRFGTLCEHIKLDPNGSTCRKLLKIGEKATRFEPFLDRMPAAWTTWYSLAVLEQHEFELVTQNKLFSPSMTAVDLKSILNKSQGGGDNIKPDLVIDLTGVSKGETIALCSAILALVQEKGGKIKPTTKLIQALVVKKKKEPRTMQAVLAEAA